MLIQRRGMGPSLSRWQIITEHPYKNPMLRSDLSWRIWRILWLLAVTAIFAQAAYTRFALPQWTFLTPDSGYYLYPMLRDNISEIGPRTIPYPLFCWALLQGTADWRSIAIAQHLLGLLGPAILLVTWFHLGRKIHVTRSVQVGHELLGLAIPLLLLPSSSYVVYEHLAMLESFNAFLQCCLGALFCVLWLPAAPRRRLLLACATSFLGVVMYYANPRWGAAAPLTVLIAVIAGVAGRDPARGWLRSGWPILAAGAAAWLIIGVPQSRIHNRNPWTKGFTAKHLLWMHADLVAGEFRRDLAATPLPANAPLLRIMEAKIARSAAPYGKAGWATLPFNPESLIYAANNPDGDLIAAFANDPDGYTRFCVDYYLRIIRHQPLAFGARVCSELVYFYTSWGGATSDFSGTLADYMKQSVVIGRALAQNALPERRPPLLLAASNLEAEALHPVAFTPPAYLFRADRLINFSLSLMTFAGIVAAAVVLSRKKLRANLSLLVSANLCVAATSTLFAQELTLALVTAAAPRYTEAVRTLVIFSVVTVVLLAACLWLKSGWRMFGRGAHA